MPSKDYAKFYIHDSQRHLSETHWMRIAEHMEQLYLLDMFPVLVDKNGNIIDGQHRYTAARLLSVQFYPLVTDMKIDDVVRANANTHKYTLDDVAVCCHKMGLEPYSDIVSLHRRFPRVSMHKIVRLNKSNPGDFVAFRFTENRPTYTERALQMADDFNHFFELIAKTFRRWGGRRQSNSGYSAAIDFLAEADGYDHKRMMKRIENAPTRLVPAKTKDEAMEILTRIYNTSAKGDSVIVLSKLKRTKSTETPIVSSREISPMRGVRSIYPICMNSTTEYGRFNVSPYARTHSKRTHDSLIAEIERANWLQCYPIVVDRNNTIVDGQLRFEAAKALGLPFWFIRDENVSFPMMLSAGATTLAWQTRDYAKHFAAEGNRNYSKFIRFTQDHNLSHHATIYAMAGIHEMSFKAHQRFKLGQFEFDEGAANRWAQAKNTVIPDMAEKDGRALGKVLYKLAATTNFTEWEKLKPLIHEDRFWVDGQFSSDDFVSYVMAHYAK